MNTIISWARRRKLDLLIVTFVLIVSGVVSAINMTSYPQRFEDEGTYVSQAWSVIDKGDLAHYTYWYDHPPLGWIQMAGYFWVTDAFDRYDSSITAGRELMLVLHVLTLGLAYALARRLGVGTIAAGLGTLAYGLSPLSIEFSRYVFLDNVALPWLIGSLFLAASPKRSLGAAVASSVCMVIAIMSKETFAVLLPVQLYLLLAGSDKRNRRYVLTAYIVVFILASSLYPLYAALKGELIPGEDHVSLIGTIAWQLSGRAGSGSVLDASSGARDLLDFWLGIDGWLLLGGLVSLPIALFRKRSRALAIAYVIGVAMMMRDGYLPFPYIVMLLPFAALLLAFAIDLGIKNLQLKSFIRLSLAQGLLISIAAAVVFAATPQWIQRIQDLTTVDIDGSSRQVVDWVSVNVDQQSRMVVESALWSDLERQGYNQPEPVWLYKTETDPAIVDEIGGWENIDYVILNAVTVDSGSFAQSFPTVAEAVENSDLVTAYGTDFQEVRIYKVR